MKFNTTYSIYTQESIENGDSDSSGFLFEDLSLSEQLSELENCGVDLAYGEANCYPLHDVRWITFAVIEHDDGTFTHHNLHFPEKLSEASRKRICKLLKVHGYTTL